ncbi:MAG: anti-sigma factor [Acidobacteriaceae bacterium]|nr:anti-sigma factor [Acidobacteriaceae bacterium]
MNCRELKSVLPDLLLNAADSSTESAARAHLASCPACSEELRSMQATFTLLDTWQAPEPSPYFDQRLAVRLREEQQRTPEGWLERIRTRFLFNTGRQFRPALASALVLVVLLAGGGTVANLHHGKTPVSATVNDLQMFDTNAQVMQNVDMLEDAPLDNGGTDVPAS